MRDEFFKKDELCNPSHWILIFKKLKSKKPISFIRFNTFWSFNIFLKFLGENQSCKIANFLVATYGISFLKRWTFLRPNLCWYFNWFSWFISAFCSLDFFKTMHGWPKLLREHTLYNDWIIDLLVQIPTFWSWFKVWVLISWGRRASSEKWRGYLVRFFEFQFNMLKVRNSNSLWKS